MSAAGVAATAAVISRATQRSLGLLKNCLETIDEKSVIKERESDILLQVFHGDQTTNVNQQGLHGLDMDLTLLEVIVLVMINDNDLNMMFRRSLKSFFAMVIIRISILIYSLNMSIHII